MNIKQYSKFTSLCYFININVKTFSHLKISCYIANILLCTETSSEKILNWTELQN